MECAGSPTPTGILETKKGSTWNKGTTTVFGAQSEEE